jgi:hypothetical protein
MRIATALPTEIASFVSRGQAGRFFARNKCPAWIRGADWRENSATSSLSKIKKTCAWVRFRAAMLMK